MTYSIFYGSHIEGLQLVKTEKFKEYSSKRSAEHAEIDEELFNFIKIIYDLRRSPLQIYCGIERELWRI